MAEIRLDTCNSPGLSRKRIGCVPFQHISRKSLLKYWITIVYYTYRGKKSVESWWEREENGDFLQNFY